MVLEISSQAVAKNQGEIMPVNLEQAKRLKEAGWIFKRNNLESGKHIINGVDISIEFPTEKEMMEWLAPHANCIFFPWDTEPKWKITFTKQFGMVRHTDLTEALIQACVKVMDGKEGRDELL